MYESLKWCIHSSCDHVQNETSNTPVKPESKISKNHNSFTHLTYTCKAWTVDGSQVSTTGESHELF